MFSFLCTLIWSVMNQIGIRFYIPLESTCFLFVAYCHEFFNRKSYDGLVVPVERELQKPPIWLINHWKKLREFVLFIKLFVITKMKILKNTLEHITRHWIRPYLHNTFYGLETYGALSKSSILKNSGFFH